MSKKRVVYADANIYLNLFLEELGNRWVSPFDEAVSFFNRVDNGELILGYSDFLIYEVKSKLKEKEKDPGIIDEFLKEMDDKGLVVKAEETSEDVQKAKAISSDHHQDPLHIILASKIGAEAFITRDNYIPEECLKMIRVCKPESLH